MLSVISIATPSAFPASSTSSTSSAPLPSSPETDFVILLAAIRLFTEALNTLRSGRWPDIFRSWFMTLWDMNAPAPNVSIMCALLAWDDFRLCLVFSAWTLALWAWSSPAFIGWWASPGWARKTALFKFPQRESPRFVAPPPSALLSDFVNATTPRSAPSSTGLVARIANAKKINMNPTQNIAQPSPVISLYSW